MHTTQSHASLVRRAPNTHAQYLYVGFSRRNKIPRCSAYDIGESNPVAASGLWSELGSKVDQLVHVPTPVELTRKMSPKSMHAFDWQSLLAGLGSLKISRRNPCSPFFSASYSIVIALRLLIFMCPAGLSSLLVVCTYSRLYCNCTDSKVYIVAI